MSEQPERRSFSPKEYARRHGVSTRTVHRWIKSGRLSVERLNARVLRIHGGIAEPVIEGPTFVDQPREATSLTGVYFIEGSGLIKIGVAWNVRDRMHELQQASPSTLRPLGFIACKSRLDAIRTESELHKRFASVRVHGEWFKDENTIREVIASVGAWPESEL